MTARLLNILLLMLLASAAGGEVYTWTDDTGRVHFGDKPHDADSARKAQKVELKINTYESVTYESLGSVAIPEARSGGKVVMYSTAWCGACKRARRYFQANNIPFTEHDIEKDAEARKAFDKLGARGVPVILVGKKRMNGFSEKGFKRIYP